MSLFKAVGNLIFGKDPPNLTDLILENGSLRLYSIKNPDKFKTIFMNSDLLVEPTGMPHQYNLIVSKLIDEDEEGDEYDESDSEKSFLIDESIKFKYEKKKEDGQSYQSFTWSFPDSKGILRSYEFLVPKEEVSDNCAKTFLNSVIGAVYERKYNTSHSDATVDDIESLTKQLAQTEISDETNGQTSSSDRSLLPPNCTLILEVKALLHHYDTDRSIYVTQGNVKVKLLKENINEIRYWFTIEGTKRNSSNFILCLPLGPNVNARFTNSLLSFTFIEKRENKFHSWMLEFNNNKDDSKFKDEYSKCLYETVNQKPYDNIKEDERGYIERSYNVDCDSDEEIKEDEMEDYEKVEETAPVKTEFTDDGTGNSQLSIGYKHDRSFVSRGSNVGVFKHGNKNDLEFYTAISNIKDSQGRSINPNKMMLHNQDSSMILMSPNDRSKLYDLDLEKGIIKQEIKVHDFLKTEDIFHTSKYSQMTPEQTLYGIASNAMYRIDPRLSGSAVVPTELKECVTKVGFTCAATTPKGEIAVASQKGEIRLYNCMGKNAKTALPANGDKIYALDITNDGQYIIATCKTYLLLVDCKIYSDKEKRTGFQKSFPKQEKPTPKRLQLKPEHVAQMGQDVEFTPAKFNAGEDILEKYIVTSTGNYLIQFNFRQVKMGKPYAYNLHPYSDRVVADNFRFGQDRSIIVAMPNDLTMTLRSQLTTPKNLFQNASKSKSKPSIVNSF